MFFQNTEQMLFMSEEVYANIIPNEIQQLSTHSVRKYEQLNMK